MHEFLEAFPLKAIRDIFDEFPFLVTFCHTLTKRKQKL